MADETTIDKVEAVADPILAAIAEAIAPFVPEAAVVIGIAGPLISKVIKWGQAVAKTLTESDKAALWAQHDAAMAALDVALPAAEARTEARHEATEAAIEAAEKEVAEAEPKDKP